MNREIKNRYIGHLYDTADIRYTILGNTLNSAEMYENLYGKDLCDFNATEIENMYKTMNHKSLTRLRNINSAFLQYTLWCQIQGLVKDGINHYEEFYGDRMYNYINRDFIDNGLITREEMLDIADEMLNPMDSFALIAIFEGFGGVSKEDFSYATLDNIKDGKMKLRNRTIEVSDEFVDYAHKSANQIVYRSRKTERYDQQLNDDGYLIYKLPLRKETKFNPRTVERRLVKELESIDFGSLGLQDIVKSGRVHYIKTKSQELNITPKEFCNIYAENLAEQFCVSADYIPVVYQDLRPFLE